MKDLILIDEVTRELLNRNPSVKDELKEFELVVQNDKALSNKFIMPMNGNNINQLIPIPNYVSKDESFAEFLVASELYKDVYFSSKTSDEQYRKEYKYILKRFVTKLGGGSTCEFFESREELREFKNKVNKQGKIGGSGKGIGVEIEGGYEDTDGGKYVRKVANKFQMTTFQPKCSKEEVEKWIAKERINVRGLPDQFRMMIEEFLEKGCLQVEYSETEEMSMETERIRSKISNVKANIRHAIASIKASFESAFETASKEKMQSEIHFYVHFKHDG